MLYFEYRCKMKKEMMMIEEVLFFSFEKDDYVRYCDDALLVL